MLRENIRVLSCYARYYSIICANHRCTKTNLCSHPVKSWLESRGTPLNTNHSHYSAFRKESVPGLMMFVVRVGDPTYHFIVIYNIYIYILYCTYVKIYIYTCMYTYIYRIPSPLKKIYILKNLLRPGRDLSFPALSMGGIKVQGNRTSNIHCLELRNCHRNH